MTTPIQDLFKGLDTSGVVTLKPSVNNIQDLFAGLDTGNTTKTPPDIDKSGGALAGSLKAITNIAEGVGDIFTKPETIIPAIKSGLVSGARGVGSLIQHPILGAKNLIVDGIFKPFLQYPTELLFNYDFSEGKTLTEAERFDRGKEITGNLSGLLVGAGIGKAIGSTTKAGQLLRAVKPKNIEEMKDLIFSLPTHDQLEILGLANKVTSKQALVSTLLRGSTEGISGGITIGLMLGDTPEERFSNAVNYGFAGAVLGNVFELVHVRGINKKLTNIKQATKEVSLKNNVESLRASLPPVDQARFAQDLFKNIHIEDAFLDWNTPRNTVVLDGLESVSNKVKNSPNAAFAQNPDGSFRVMIDGSLKVIDRPKVDITGLGAKVSETINQPRNLKAQAALEAKRAKKVPIELDPEVVGLAELQERGVSLDSGLSAFVDKKGKVYVGFIHADALDLAELAGKELGDLTEGFYFPNQKRFAETDSEFRSAEEIKKASGPSGAKLPSYDETRLNEFRKSKFIPNQEVLINGKSFMYIDNPDGKQIKARVMNLDTGKVTLKSFNKVNYASTFNIVEHYGSELATKKPLTDLIPVSPKTSVVNITKQYNEILSKLEPGDRLTYEKNLSELEAYAEQPALSTAESASVKGYYIGRREAGQVEVFNPATKQSLGVFKTAEDAAKFIEDAPGISTDYILANGRGGNFNVPPHMPGENFNFENSKYGADTRKAGIFDKIKTSYLAYLVNRRELFLSIESRWKDTRFYNDVFQPMQIQTLKFMAARTPIVNEINAIVSKHSDVMKSSAKREQILSLLERRSPDEYRTQGYYAGRKLTPNELSLGEELAKHIKDSPESLARVIQYKRALEEISKAYPTKVNEKLQQFIDAELGGSVTPEEVKALSVLTKAIKDTNVTNGAVIDYAKSILNDVKDEAEFVKTNKIDANTLATANSLREFFTKYEQKYGKPPTQLFKYVTHVKNFADSIYEKSYIEAELTPLEREIFKRLSAGNLSSYLIDPFDMAVKYIDTALHMEHIAETLAKARRAVNEGSKIIAVENPVAARMIRNYGEKYLYEISGGPNGFDSVVSAAFHNAASKLAPRVAAKTRISFVNTWLRIVEFAAQGFKPLAGVRDVSSGLAIVHMRFGEDGLYRIMRTFGDVMDSKESWKREGIIPGLAPNRFETALDVAARESLSGIKGGLSKATGFIRKMEEYGFKYSGQPTAYEFLHGAIYLERMQTASKVISDYFNKKITRKQFDKKLDLDTYDPVIIREFDQKLQTSPQNAAKYLARVSGEEVVGYYGMANHPMFMSSKYGKIMGQFGQWPIWFLNTTERMIANASPTKKAAILARMGAVSSAYILGGSALGFNFNNWRTDPVANVYTFSPATDILWWMIKSTSNYGPTREFAQDQLLNYVDFSNPRKIYLPVPFQVFDILEAGQRILQGDPAHIVTWKLVGGSVDVQQYPRP